MTRKNKKLKIILNKISTPSENFIDALDNGEEIQKEQALKAYKAISTPEEKIMDFLENIDDLKGKDGESPTPELLLELIKPLIPEPMKGNDGKTPTNEEIIFLIKPLIPTVKDGKDGHIITPEEVRDKLKELKGKSRLSVFDLKDTEWLKGKNGEHIQWNAVGALSKVSHDATLTGDGTLSNPLSVVDNDSSINFVDNEIVGGSGTSYTLANTPILGSEHVFAKGQRYYSSGPNTGYSISGKIITITDGSSYGLGDILADYRK